MLTMLKWLCFGCKINVKEIWWSNENKLKSFETSPSWQCWMVAPKSLSGQPLDQFWIRLARKGFCSYCTAMSSGGLFQSSWAHFHGALKNLWHYFTIQTKPFEPCLLSWIFCIRKSSIKVMIKLFQVLEPVHHFN